MTHLPLLGWVPAATRRAKIKGGKPDLLHPSGLMDAEGRFLFWSGKCGVHMYARKRNLWRQRKAWRTITTVQLEGFISFLNEETHHGLVDTNTI